MNGKLRNREETFLGTCICKTWNVANLVEIAIAGLVALVLVGFMTKIVIKVVKKTIRLSETDQY